MASRLVALLIAPVFLLGCSSGGSSIQAPGPQWARGRADERNTGLGFPLDQNDGRLTWRVDLGAPIRTTASIGVDGTLYVGTDASGGAARLFAVAPEGGVDWVFPSDAGNGLAPILSSPALDRFGDIYFGTEEGRVYAVNADGEEVWCFDVASTALCAGPGSGLETEHAVRTSPLLELDPFENRVIAVFFGSEDGRFFAVGAEDGELRWQFSTGGAIAGSPAVDADSVIYVPSEDGHLYGLLRDGSAGAFRFPRGSAAIPLRGSPSVGTDVIFQSGVAADGRGTVIALNPNETERWPERFIAEGVIISSPAQRGRIAAGELREDLFVVDDEGRLYVLDGRDGRPTGVCAAGVDEGDPCSSDGDCASGTCQSSLVSLGAFVSASPVVGTDGTILIATAPEDGSAAAVFALERRLCVGGDSDGDSCRVDADCPGDLEPQCAPDSTSESNPIIQARWTFSQFCDGGAADREGCGSDADCDGGVCRQLGAVRSSPSTASDGTIYVGSDDGHLYALGRDDS